MSGNGKKGLKAMEIFYSTIAKKIIEGGHKAQKPCICLCPFHCSFCEISPKAVQYEEWSFLIRLQTLIFSILDHRSMMYVTAHQLCFLQYLQEQTENSGAVALTPFCERQRQNTVWTVLCFNYIWAMSATHCELAGVPVMLYTCIWEVPISNLDWYICWSFSWFPLVPSGICQ